MNAGRSLPSAGIGWILWAVLVALPWLLPTHSAPWTTVYQELIMAAAALGVAAWTVLKVRLWKADVLVVAFVLAAFIPLLQAAAGMFALPAEAPLVSLYLVGFATTLLLSRHAEEAAPGHLIDALFAGLLIAGLLSSGLALYQWLGGDALGLLVIPMPFRDRPFANVGQPNNLATLLVWAMISTWWGYSRGKIGAFGAILAVGFLIVGLTLTQSRTGHLEVALLGAAAFFARKRLRTSSQWPAFAGLALWLVVCIFALEPLSAQLTEQVTRPLLNSDSPRERTMLLKTVLSAISEHPWKGYGWYQNVPAHVAVYDQYSMHGIIANSHNIILDLIVWNGFPLAMLMVFGLCLWYWQAARRVVSSDQAFLLLALATFSVHTALELPHVFAYFLVPVAMMMGTLSAHLPLKRSVPVHRAAVATLVLLFGVVLLELFAEYRRVEVSLIDSRMRDAHIAGAPAKSDARIRLLGPLQSWLAMREMEPKRGMPQQELDAMRRTLTRYPNAYGLLRYAQATAMNGSVDDANWAVGVLCSLHSEATCASAATDWATLVAAEGFDLASVKVPAAAASASR